MSDRYTVWADDALADKSIGRDDALAILRGDDIDLMALLAAAGRVRRHHFGNTVSIHILDNVRNGACPEDCGYCGQSSVSDAPIKPYKIKSVDEIVAEARQAKEAGAWRFCMALSGRGPSERDVEHMCEAVRRIGAMGIRTCLSAGLLDEHKARKLKEAGLGRFNHNLNTSRRHYPAICTTHTYDDRIKTLGHVREAGIGMCSGLIVGMGESYEDIVDVAMTLRSFRAESIPINFLLPIEGNALIESSCEGKPLEPQLVLRVLCMVRLMNPDAEVRVAAGREVHLRSMQAMALWPANSLFMAGYLLTEGDDAAATMRMILDAGFAPRLDVADPPGRNGEWPEHLRRIAESAPAGRTCENSRTYLKPTVSAVGS